MAKTGNSTRPAAAKAAAAAQVAAAKAGGHRKVALALQGSFGHIVYAAGVLDAFRAHNHKVRAASEGGGAKAIEVALASGCVEMMTPLWLYLADPQGGESLRDAVVNDDFSVPWWAQLRIAPPQVRADAWGSYFNGLLNAQGRVAAAGLKLLRQGTRPNALAKAFCHGLEGGVAVGSWPAESAAQGTELGAAWQDLCMYASGLPGQMAFNPLFVAARQEGLQKLCGKVDGPTIFTNATRAEDLGEIYLYSGSDPDAGQLQAMQQSGKRRVLRLTPEYFFASGARPPYIDPVPVTVDERTEHWMEGAMRCNPPLNPLIDMGATDIVLLRFFCKDAKEEPNNNGELNERFIDAVFNIPLQKEIESIAFNNKVAGCTAHIPAAVRIAQDLPDRRQVRLLDPGDHGNPAHCRSYTDFLNDDLGSLSHFDGLTAARRAQMFERGVDIGRQLIRHLQPLLP